MTVPAACTRCGNGIPAGAPACPVCGQPVGPPPGQYTGAYDGPPAGQPTGHTTEPVWLPGTTSAPPPPAGSPTPQQQSPAPQQEWQGIGEATVLGAPRVPTFNAPKPPLVDGSAATAGMGARFGAAVIDGLILAVPQIVAAAVSGSAAYSFTVNNQPLVEGGREPATASHLPIFLAGLVSLLLFAGMLAWEGASGRTVGKVALGLRTVDVATGGPLGIGRAMLRGLIVFAGYCLCGIGALLVVLSPLFDSGPLRQGWQDKVGRARVMSVRGGGSAPSRDAYATSGLPAPVAERGASDLFPPPAAPQTPLPSPATSAAPAWGGPVPSPAPSWGTAPAAPAPAGPARAWSAPAAPDGLVTGVPGAAPQVPPPAPAQPSGQSYGQPPAPSYGQPPAPAAPQQPDGPGPHGTAPRFELDLGDGQRVPLTGPTLLGRDPAPQAGTPTGPAGPRLVSVPDPQRSISKTHAEMGVDSHGAWLIDRGSTNGTFVTPPRGTERRVSAGEQVRVPVGATLRLGERRLIVLDGGISDETVLSARDLPPQGGGSW